MSTTRSYIGKGTIYLQKRGVAGAALAAIGNCSKLVFNIEQETKKELDYESAGGGAKESLQRITSVTAALTAYSFSADNLALALRGTASANAGVTAITGEAKAGIALGSLVVLNRLPNLTVAPVVKKSGTTIAASGNYELRRAGIYILPNAAGLTAGDNITVDYTPLPDNLVEALTAAANEYYMVFDGLNEADSGKAQLVEAWRVKFSPAKAFDLLGDDFGTLELEAEVLSDDTKAGVGTSGFFRARAAA